MKYTLIYGDLDISRVSRHFYEAWVGAETYESYILIGKNI